ncbi:MAG: sugar porter family MFS transporter [bacterium]|nr:sugar porter family MFS transporter [bacterium]
MPANIIREDGDLASTSGNYKKGMTIFIILFAGLGGILYGYDIGVISGALLFLDKTIHLTTEQTGFIVGAVLGGGAFATLVAGFLADIFGRKKVIIWGTVFFLIGVVFTVIANSYLMLLWGRLIQGVGIGVVSMVIPLFITEVAPAKVRGRAISLFQLFLTLGISLAFVVDLAFTPTGNWRAMFGMVIIPGVIFIIGAFFLPESPTWLFMKKTTEKVKETLLRIYDEEDSNIIIGQMGILKLEKIELAKTGRKKETLFKKAYMVPFFIALFIAILQQFTGINVVLQYVPVIFKSSGVHSNFISMLLSTGLGVLNVLFTVVALILIDKLGRKLLLSIGTCGLTLGLAICGFSFMFSGYAQAVVLCIGLVIFMCLYSAGPGVIVWLAMSEILPANIRGKGMAICLFANSLASAFLSSVVLLWSEAIGFEGVFWIFVVCSCAYTFIALFIIPETKGKTLEEIEEYFRGHDKA